MVIPTRRLIRESHTLNKISSKGGKLLIRSLLLFNDLILFIKKKISKLYVQAAIPVHLTWVKSLPSVDSKNFIHFLLKQKHFIYIIFY